MGTFGSRSLAVGGTALAMSLDKVVEKGRKIAAHILEAAAADIEFSDGSFRVSGTDKTLAFAEIAGAAYVPHNYPLDELEPGPHLPSMDLGLPKQSRCVHVFWLHLGRVCLLPLTPLSVQSGSDCTEQTRDLVGVRSIVESSLGRHHRRVPRFNAPVVEDPSGVGFDLVVEPSVWCHHDEGLQSIRVRRRVDKSCCASSRVGEHRHLLEAATHGQG